MADVVSPAVRSRMMSGIRGANTKPELIIRRALHARGFRFRIHTKDLPGRPDIVLPRFRAALLIHGCFWHGHDCRFFRLPSTRPDFWRLKINSNRARDERNLRELRAKGWRVATIWECSLRGATCETDAVVKRLAEWISGKRAAIEIRG